MSFFAVSLRLTSRLAHLSTSLHYSQTEALLLIHDAGGHPNVCGLRDMYESPNHYFLILDLVSGGEMFEHLIQNGAYSEHDAATHIKVNTSYSLPRSTRRF